MKKRVFNSRTFRQLLSMLGFGSATFVFSACYRPVPREYQNGAYADSVSTTLQATLEEADSLTSSPDTEQTDSIQ
jgi:hypothetical protein